MSEYGGYLNLEKNYNKEYYTSILCFNTASNALIYFAKTKRISKLLLPYFLCDSIKKKLAKNNIEYDFYYINDELEPLYNKTLKKDEYLYIVNYYGILSNSDIGKYKAKYKRIIIDNVQSFFQKPVEKIPTIYSCRKYFGVPDGAYLFADNLKRIKLKQDNSYDRYKHIIGRLDGNASDYYDSFKENEEKLIKEECKYMSTSTHTLLSNINYKFVIKQRNINYKELSSKLDSFNMLKTRKQTGPYCYPLYIKNGNKIRKELIKKKIYVPILWPNVLELEDCIEKEYAENILPLPCDQRYDAKDMKYIANIVIKLIKKYNK